MTTEPIATLLARVDDALAARDRLRRRPLGDTVAALAAAGERWRHDAQLVAELPAAARLSPAMIAEILPHVADALDVAVMTKMLEADAGAGAAERPPADGPALVAHVVASNVPALANPAIALGCLAGAAVLVKSGRDDRLSAPAFHRALRDVDPALADTVVAVYWPGGDVAREHALLRRADVVVVTGRARTIDDVTARASRRIVTHGPRVSAAVVGRDADQDEAAAALALDVALYDQRGCLSPHAVYVEREPARFAARLAGALDAVAMRLPAGDAPIDERAAARLDAAEAEWAGTTEVLARPGGTVLYEREVAAVVPTRGHRTVRVHPLTDLAALAALVPAGEIECVGGAGIDPEALAAALRGRGVSRICPLGRMQRPRLSWPRGQRAPLGVLLGRNDGPVLEVEA